MNNFVVSSISGLLPVRFSISSLFGGRRAGGYGRNNRSGGRFGRDRAPREMHKATCGDCGNECEIPFEPRNDKPVYCNDCFPNHKRN